MHVLFEDNTVKIELNSSKDILVTEKTSGVKASIIPHIGKGLLITSPMNIMTPESSNNTPAFLIRKER